MKVRIIYNHDKTVSVIHPAPKSKKPDETEDQWLERVFSKATPQGAVFDDIDSSELPATREDRMAWEGEKGKGITVNIIKAQEIKNSISRTALIESEKQKILEAQAIQNLIDRGLISA